MWYFPLLRPFVDHVPVKADMSDLEEKIQWCRDNDEKCREIATNAKKLYDQYCAKEGILDYLEIVTHKIADRWHHVPTWWEPAPLGFQKPGGEREQSHHHHHHHYRGGGGGGNDRCTCRRCLEDKEKASR